MQKSTNNTVVFGFWVYLMSDVVLFATLFAAYAVLQGQTFGSLHIAELTSLSFVLAETLILLASSFAVGLGVLAACFGKKLMALSLLGTTLALGAAFLAMEAYEFWHLVAEGHGPWVNASYSAFFTLVGTHGLHVFFGLVWGAVLLAQALRWGFSGAVMQRLNCFSLFWHFLDVIWIFIFTFVYLVGALLL